MKVTLTNNGQMNNEPVALPRSFVEHLLSVPKDDGAFDRLQFVDVSEKTDTAEEILVERLP